MRTRSKGELACDLEFVPGHPKNPLTESDVNEKVEDCLRLGVKPLQKDAIGTLLKRVREADQVADMSRFFEGVC